MPRRKPELDRIIKDLKVFVTIACEYDPDGNNDFISESCNDAYLMLEQAREKLDEAEKAE